MSTKITPKQYIIGIKLSLISIFIVFAPAALTKDIEYGNAFVFEVTSIYDADTFRATIKEWPQIIGERIPIRVNGIDAPEIRGKCQEEKIKAREAKKESVAMLRSAKQIELRNIKRGKYFRIIADVYLDGKSLAQVLIIKGLARPYDGKKRQGWCKKGA